jgi:hypothetical protein
LTILDSGSAFISQHDTGGAGDISQSLSRMSDKRRNRGSRPRCCGLFGGKDEPLVVMYKPLPRRKVLHFDQELQSDGL